MPVKRGIRPGSVIFLCLLCYLTSLKMALAFLFAAAFHELGHCIAIYLCGGRVQAAGMDGRGAVLRISAVPPGRELICALAGPFFSFLLVPIGRYFPNAALFALGQGLYNLLPIYPLDGGRALYCALQLGLKQEIAWPLVRGVGTAAGILLTALGIYAAVIRHFGIAPAIFAGFFLYQVLRLWRNE